MADFLVTSETINAQYEYKDTSIIVQGGYVKDAKTDGLLSLQGSCYRNNSGNVGDYVGNFNGYIRNGEIKYDLSEMTRADSNLVWDAIDDIESNVLPQSNGE